LLTRALSIRAKTFVRDHVDVAETLNNLANVYRGQGRFVEAEPLLERARRFERRVWGAIIH